LQFGVLGPLEVVDDDGTPVDLGGTQPRTVLALLLTSVGRVVNTDVILDAVWGEAPPASAPGTLQSYVSRLRRALEPDRLRGDSPKVLTFEPPGYRLSVDREHVDYLRFEALADAGREQLAARRFAEARSTLLDADARWRGPALAEHRDHEFAVGLIARLEARRLAALEDRMAAELELGNHAAVIGELAELVNAHPLQEGFRARLALALYRSGRQAEALRALDDARRTLRDELGIEPSRALRDLEGAILRHDDAIDVPLLDAPPGSLGAIGDASSTTPAAPQPRTAAPAAASAPVAASGPTVSSAPGGRDTNDAAMGPLVGRVAELAELRACVDEATAASRAVVVEGEPGIGKTRLVEEAAAYAAARGATVLWGRAFEGGAAPAYWPWLPPLRALTATLPPELEVSPEIRRLLSSESREIELPAAADNARFSLFEGVVSLLVHHASIAPLVLVLDDLQWADVASLELLSLVAGRIDDAPLLIIATVRELEVGRNDALVETLAALTRRWGTRRLLLRGLSEADTRELVAQTTGADIEGPQAALIHGRSEGNPFFTTELARLLATGDALSSVPSGVRDVVRRRLAMLPESSGERLRVAAVIGRDVDLDLLARASGGDLDACLDDLEPALVQRLLVTILDQPGSFRFAHALVREVLVDGMSSLRRARLHLRVADALDDRDDNAEIRAEHLLEAVAIGAGRRAAEALERAATVAIGRFAYVAAHDLLERAVSLRRAAGSTPEDRNAELDATARLLSVIGARYGYSTLVGSPVLARGKQLALETGREVELMNMLWAEWAGLDLACEWERSYPIAVELLDHATRSGVDSALTSAHTAYGISCWHRGELVEAGEHLDRARDLAGAIPVGTMASQLLDLDQLRLCLPFSIYIHDLCGDLDDPEAEYDAVARLLPDDPYWELLVMNFAASSAMSVGSTERSLRAARRGAAADPEGNYAFWGRCIRCYGAAALMQQGDITDGRPLLRDAWASYSSIGSLTNGVSYASEEALALARAGDVEGAREAFERAVELLRVTHEVYAEPVLRLAQAFLRRAEGAATDEVGNELRRAHDLATTHGSRAIARRIARAAEEIGLAVP
jgi:DNA-binding SARP family transcriptional activator